MVCDATRASGNCSFPLALPSAVSERNQPPVALFAHISTSLQLERNSNPQPTRRPICLLQPQFDWVSLWKLRARLNETRRVESTYREREDTLVYAHCFHLAPRLPTVATAKSAGNNFNRIECSSFVLWPASARAACSEGRADWRATSALSAPKGDSSHDRAERARTGWRRAGHALGARSARKAAAATLAGGDERAGQSALSLAGVRVCVCSSSMLPAFGQPAGQPVECELRRCVTRQTHHNTRQREGQTMNSAALLGLC